MQYLIIDGNAPFGKTLWSPRIENATPFATSKEANAAKESTIDAAGVVKHDGRWYVVKGTVSSH